MDPVPLYLAPMAGVTDLPFRLLAKECGADITVTEFTAAAGLNRDDARSWRRLESDPRESPFIPQIFGGVEEEMVGTTRALSSVADIIDLNFGSGTMFFLGWVFFLDIIIYLFLCRKEIFFFFCLLHLVYLDYLLKYDNEHQEDL